jgi:hypothetical protein
MTHFDELRHSGSTASLVPTAFALFEKAGHETGDYRKNLIETANNMLLFREQYTIAQKVYTPQMKGYPTGRYTVPGELNRSDVMREFTPTIALDLGKSHWTMGKYVRNLLEHKPLRQYNWANFDDRWDPILDAVSEVYKHPAQMWPLPNPNPASLGR